MLRAHQGQVQLVRVGTGTWAMSSLAPKVRPPTCQAVASAGLAPLPGGECVLGVVLGRLCVTQFLGRACHMHVSEVYPGPLRGDLRADLGVLSLNTGWGPTFSIGNVLGWLKLCPPALELAGVWVSLQVTCVPWAARGGWWLSWPCAKVTRPCSWWCQALRARQPGAPACLPDGDTREGWGLVQGWPAAGLLPMTGRCQACEWSVH